MAYKGHHAACRFRFLSIAPLLITTVLAAGALTRCGQESQKSGTPPGPQRLAVVATTGMVGDAVEVIAGDRVELNTLMGPGVDPHLYKTTKGDLDLLSDADVVFYNGLNLEAKMADILKKMGRTKTTVAVAESIPDSLLHYPDGSSSHPDPHIWFDVSLWAEAVDRVAQTLASQDPPNAELYLNNVSAYLDTLDKLHAWVTEQVQSIPVQQRLLVTAHDAFGYFGRAYDIEVMGLQGISTITEAGLYDVTQMVDMLVGRGVKAVFVETSVPKRAINAVVEGCQARGHQVIIGGELFSDAMGRQGSPEGTYVGMVRHNVNTIVRSLK
jgi:manganese/zinc/iron transport system substrate-binding protein